MNLYSTQFVDLINEIGDLDAVYISLGDGTEAAFYIQNVINRSEKIKDKVKIFSLIHDDIRYKNLTEHNFNISKNISFFGWDSELYKPEYIYNYKREAKAIGIGNTDCQGKSDECERLSSLAKTYHEELMRFLYSDGLTAREAHKIKQEHNDIYNLTNPKT